MSDRPVATDALATLGTIIDDTQKRDAIHLAVSPTVAGERLEPGEHVFIRDGKAYGSTGATNAPPLLGIVDPFLTEKVNTGQRFWLVIYPRVITSLRHVWAHPAFPDEAGTGAMPAPDRAASEAWLQDFCAKSDCPDYYTVLAAATNGRSSWDADYLHFDGRDAHGEIPPEFWDHVEIVTGQKIDGSARAKYFSCSC